MHHSPSVSHIAFIGLGGIGTSWAALALYAGYEVSVWDSNDETQKSALDRINCMRNELRERFGTEENPTSPKIAKSLADVVCKAGYVVECVVDDIAIKRKIFVEAEKFALPETILASATSTFPPDTLFRSIKSRERCLVMHPMHPPHLLPLVEIASCKRTTRSTVEQATTLAKYLGQVPIILDKQSIGFVSNRLQAVLLNEAMRLITLNLCTAQDIDTVLKYGLAPRWSVMGPLEAVETNTTGGFAAFAEHAGEMMKWIKRQHNNVDPWALSTIERVKGEMAASLDGTPPEIRRNEIHRTLIRQTPMQLHRRKSNKET